MKESLDLINSNKIYKKIFLEVYSKYKKYGKITGSFTLKAATTEERQILFNFDSKALTEGKAKIKCSTVRDLFNRKLKEYSFEELLVKVVGKELKTNKEVKDEEKEQEEKFYDDMDLIEANEAFAAQSIAVARDLKFDMSKVNVNGGAIALGHPVGASGCRILVTLLHEMQKRDAKRGLATLCIGGGMGCSTIVER